MSSHKQDAYMMQGPLEQQFSTTQTPHLEAEEKETEDKRDDEDQQSHTQRADSAYGSTRSGSTTSIIAADDDFEDEAYDESSNSSYLSSIASSVRRGVVENGRVYPNYGKHEYPMPIDEEELDRNDLQHAKFTLLLDNKFFLSPISLSPTRILDVGTGTGIWAIDVGDLYPGAEVIGTDIAPVQPSWVPPNVQFVIEDAEDMWTFTSDSFDFVFGRELSFAVRDWAHFISQAYAVIKPGGWLELCATDPQTHCDDGSLDLKASIFVQTVGIYFEIAEAMGASLKVPHRWSDIMRQVGFVDVQEHYVKMPMGPWAKDRRLKKVGVLELAQLNQGYEAYMIRGWTQVLKRKPEELYALIAAGRKEVNDRKHHTYAHFIVITGRKPDI